MSDVGVIRDTINGVALLTFIALAVVAVVTMAERAVRHRVLGSDAPILLYRDLVLIGALALITLTPALWHLVTGQVLGVELWWVIVRSVIGTGALAIWVYFELRVIGRTE